MQIVLALLFPAILLGSLWCWIYGLQRLWQGHSLIDREPRRPVPWDILDLVLVVLFLAGTQTAASLVVQRVLKLPSGTTADQLDIGARGMLILGSSLATLAAFALSLLTIRLRTGAGWRDLGLRGDRLLSDIGLGVAAFVMLAPPIYLLQFVLVQWIESKHPLIELLKQQPDAKFFVLSGFSAVLVAPLVEEYLFRLLLQGWLEKVFAFGGRRGWFSTFADFERPWPDECPLQDADRNEDPHQDTKADKPAIAAMENAGDAKTGEDNRTGAAQPEFVESSGTRSDGEPHWLASLGPIAISSTLFALLHFNHGPDWVPLLILALGLGYLYNRTHRLVPCITVHFLLNSLTLLALLAEVYKGG